MRKIQFHSFQMRSILFLCIVSAAVVLGGPSGCSSKKTNPANSASAQKAAPVTVSQKLAEAGIPYSGDEKNLILKITADAAFPKAKSSPTETCIQQITLLAGILSQHPSVTVKVDGHTDSRGNATANLKLSKARSETIKGILVKNGIAADRVQAFGYGSTRPSQSNKTPAGREENRRMEIHLSAN